MADEDLSPFEPEPGAEFVWMQHEAGTMPAQFPAASVKDWRARGWKPCAAPSEMDPALIEHQLPAPQPVPEPEPALGSKSKGVNENA